ncbi:hypothetical protein D0Z07_8555 [Hyphodiscus hymeniophilus]|uniref:Acyltransferase 3 domain-containing protein n=1 Tax=Hyphodiscus hymeniophilus TaxID=353542 RepID=A0A9P6VDU3_9HELO|nr:hypothetical protein D0Z07_8555 [Hyphodiscus hymeniophilus]
MDLSSGFRKGEDSNGLSSFMERAERFKTKSPTVYDQEYLIGFRGFLVIQAFLWVFLQTFVPVAVVASDDVTGEAYQLGLRKSLSVFFWNEYFLYGAVVFLSARSIAIPYIRNPKKEIVARSVMTRGIALWFPIAVSLAIIKIAFTATGGLDPVDGYVTVFKQATNNLSLTVPYMIPNTLAYFNSVFDMLWTTHEFELQAGSTAFPSQTMWIVNCIYSQSYTVYLTMIIIPFTRRKWRVQGAFFFVITAWWCESWAWYSITGLLFCDMVMTMDFKAAAQRGIPIHVPVLGRLQRKNGVAYRIPVWVPAGLCMIAGYTMQFLWVAWRPDLFAEEWKYHSGLYYTAGLNYLYETSHTAARDDIYLILLGFFTLLESYDFMQRFFANRFFVFLGKRSLSYFLVQSTMIYLVGIKTFQSMRGHNSFPGSVIVSFITSLLVTIPVAEAFYRIIQEPSKVLAHKSYDFITS